MTNISHVAATHNSGLTIIWKYSKKVGSYFGLDILMTTKTCRRFTHITIQNTDSQQRNSVASHTGSKDVVMIISISAGSTILEKIVNALHRNQMI